MEWIFLTLYNIQYLYLYIYIYIYIIFIFIKKKKYIQYTCTILYVLILNSFPHVCVYVCVKNMPTITAPTIFTVEENF